ncbi:unnamed protein product, partial [marine sediment metagenome]
MARIMALVYMFSTYVRFLLHFLLNVVLGTQ